jgi:hypothetical protein
MDKILTGVKRVEYKWDLVFLSDNVVEETLPLDKFRVLLLQSFDSDYIIKIVEALTSEKPLLIDFDKEIVKVIAQKQRAFEENLLYYFNPDNVAFELENIESGVDIYTLGGNNG